MTWVLGGFWFEKNRFFPSFQVAAAWSAPLHTCPGSFGRPLELLQQTLAYRNMDFLKERWVFQWLKWWLFRSAESWTADFYLSYGSITAWTLAQWLPCTLSTTWHVLSKNGRGPAYTWKPTNPKSIQQFPSEWLSIGFFAIQHSSLGKPRRFAPHFLSGNPYSRANRCIRQSWARHFAWNNNAATKLGSIPWTKKH